MKSYLLNAIKPALLTDTFGEKYKDVLPAMYVFSKVMLPLAAISLIVSALYCVANLCFGLPLFEDGVMTEQLSIMGQYSMFFAVSTVLVPLCANMNAYDEWLKSILVGVVFVATLWILVWFISGGAWYYTVASFLTFLGITEWRLREESQVKQIYTILNKDLIKAEDKIGKRILFSLRFNQIQSEVQNDEIKITPFEAQRKDLNKILKEFDVEYKVEPIKK